MDLDSLITLLLKNRHLTTQVDINQFFHPTDPVKIDISAVGLDKKAIKSAIQLIKQHIKADHKIAVFGDYDVDGITASAIIWETLHRLTPNVFPYIPHRRTEGYGLSKAGIDACLHQGAKLIITVDNGIVAHSEVAYARSMDCDLIIIDHHEPGASRPVASVVLHSTRTSAAGLAWFVAGEIGGNRDPELLSLAAISVICDLVPLIGVNRSLAKFGLEQLNRTTRPGLLSLFDLSGIRPGVIDTYHVGFVIGPRLNAMGRLEHAFDSLRLICTQSVTQAHKLAQLLADTNSTRQDLTKQSVDHALAAIERQYGADLPKLLIVADSSYDQGIIGLIASKLVEKYSRPAIAVSIGDLESKASARSVVGFNITDHIRTVSRLLLGVGGHAMASGFTVATQNLSIVIDLLVTSAQTVIDSASLVKRVGVEADIPLELVTWDLHRRLSEFAPFGLGNPHPVFSTSGLTLQNSRAIGKTGNHLKFQATNGQQILDCIWFNSPFTSTSLPSQPDSLVYQILQNDYNGRTSLQLQVKTLL